MPGVTVRDLSSTCVFVIIYYVQKPGFAKLLYLDGYAAPPPSLDQQYDDDDCNFSNPNISDQNIYILGRVGKHNVVIVCLPEAGTGTNSAAAIAIQMKSAFPSIRFGLMVGVGGGVPSGKSDAQLGNVVVSRPGNSHGGVVQYDFGENTPNGF